MSRCWYVVAICLMMYIISARGHLEVSDTAYSLQTAEAIVNRGKLDIPYERGDTLKGPNGRSYSKYGIGLAFYYIPWVAAADALSKLTGLPGPLLTEFLLSFANIPFAILALISFARLLHYFQMSERCVFLLVLALGLGTLAWRYSVYDFSEEMQMGLLMLALYCMILGSSRATLAGGVAFACLFLVKLVYVVFAPVLIAYLIVRPGEMRQRLQRAAVFGIPLILAFCVVAWLNAIRFGSPLESGYGTEAHMFLFSQMWLTIPQLLVSFDKGLLIYCPILVLGIYGWTEFARRYPREAALCTALITANLILAAAWHSWEGGWSWGPRLLVPAIPLWLLPGAFLIERWKRPRQLGVFALLMVVSVLVQVPGILVNDQEVHDIKYFMLAPGQRALAPSEFATSCILLRHKLASHNEVYPVSEFHIPGDRKLDLTRYRALLGFDLWTEHAARQFNRPRLRWFPLAVLLLVGCLAVQLGKSLETNARAEVLAKTA